MWMLKEYFQDSNLSLHHRGSILQSKYQKMFPPFSQKKNSGEACLFGIRALAYILQNYYARMSDQKDIKISTFYLYFY